MTENSSNTGEKDEYKLHLLSLRKEFLIPKITIESANLLLISKTPDNFAKLPFRPELNIETPRIEIPYPESPDIIIKQKARQRMCSRPSLKLLDTEHIQSSIFFRIPWSKIPRDKEVFYDAILSRDLSISPRDILFLQYYPFLPLHRVEKLQFLDKQLHASFHTEIAPKREVQRLYYVNRLERKPTFIDLPL